MGGDCGVKGDADPQLVTDGPRPGANTQQIHLRTVEYGGELEDSVIRRFESNPVTFPILPFFPDEYYESMLKNSTNCPSIIYVLRRVVT